MFSRNILFLSVISAALLFSGCANKQIANQAEVDSAANEKVEQFLGDNERALNDAELAYKKAKQAELDFYAPLHMEQIHNTLKSAQSLELEGKQQEIHSGLRQSGCACGSWLKKQAKNRSLIT